MVCLWRIGSSSKAPTLFILNIDRGLLVGITRGGLRGLNPGWSDSVGWGRVTVRPPSRIPDLAERRIGTLHFHRYPPLSLSPDPPARYTWKAIFSNLCHATSRDAFAPQDKEEDSGYENCWLKNLSGKWFCCSSTVWFNHPWLWLTAVF